MGATPVVALEIGTTKTLALVGEKRDDGHIMIIGLGEQPSSGVRKGEIIDVENCVNRVRSVLEKAEEASNVAIRQVHLAVSGGHIQSLVNRGAVPVLDAKGGEIGQDDIDQVMEVAGAVNLPADRARLHSICQHFCVDDQQRVVKPDGMSGARLSLDMLVLHGSRSRLHNTIKVVRSVPVEVQDVVFSGLCSAMAVLSADQRRNGVLVVDLGGGTTDYVAYADNVVVAAGALGLGGDHVTNDVALAFGIPTAQAESLKRESGSAVVDPEAGGQRVALPPDVGSPAKSVGLKSLQMVTNARMDEILGTIRKRLEGERILHHLSAGVVLTGGGAHLKNVTELGGRVFGLQCQIGRPRGVTGLTVATEGPQYATGSGLVQYAFKAQEESGEGPVLSRWIRRVLGW